jgi:hypothetical protein
MLQGLDMSASGSPASPPELTRPIALERIGTRWHSHRVVASDAERAALAQRFGLLELPALSAELRLRRARAGRYVEIDGVLQARVVQSCVVTLEPVDSALDEPFALLLGPIGAPAPEPASSELIVDLDEPEPLEGDEIDIGELVAQQLSLALDPYPRAKDAPDPAAAALGGDTAAPEPPADGPFAALRARRKPS